MNAIILILILSTWYLSGVTSFIFWWTKESDYCDVAIVVSLMAGLIGPIAFGLGYIIHGDGEYDG